MQEDENLSNREWTISTPLQRLRGLRGYSGMVLETAQLTPAFVFRRLLWIGIFFPFEHEHRTKSAGAMVSV